MGSAISGTVFRVGWRPRIVPIVFHGSSWSNRLSGRVEAFSSGKGVSGDDRMVNGKRSQSGSSFCEALGPENLTEKGESNMFSNIEVGRFDSVSG